MMTCGIWAAIWTIPPVFKAADGTAYRLDGPEDGPPLVLIHGLGLSSSLWQAHLPALCARYRVLSYDLYGHGQSRPAERPLSLLVFADQIARLLEDTALGPAHLIGFSIGGMINRRVAMDHPHLVRSLAILNSPHDRGAQMQQEVETRARKALDQGAEATLKAALERWFTPEFLASNTDIPRQVAAWRIQADRASYGQSAWVLAHGVRELIRPVPALKVPSLVMTCAEDVGSTPQMSRDIAAEIAGAECRIIPRFKHLGLLESPEAFTQPLLDFLQPV
jgi:pimeloyl-ACP methyl ester carboxylesterase